MENTRETEMSYARSCRGREMKRLPTNEGMLESSAGCNVNCRYVQWDTAWYKDLFRPAAFCAV